MGAAPQVIDREAMLVGRRVIAKRVRRDVDAAVVAAEEKRSAFLDWFIAEMRTHAAVQQERERIVAALLQGVADGDAPAARDLAVPPANPSENPASSHASLARSAAA